MFGQGDDREKNDLEREITQMTDVLRLIHQIVTIDHPTGEHIKAIEQIVRLTEDY